MPETVNREEVQRLVVAGGQLVEVLPREEYEELHLAGAVSIPLKELGERAPVSSTDRRPSSPIATTSSET